MFNYEDIVDIPGWMDEPAAKALYHHALKAPGEAILEIGTFCGKTSVVLAQAIQRRGHGQLICCDRFQSNVRYKKNYKNPDEKPGIIKSTLGRTMHELNKRGLSEYVTLLKLDHADLPETLYGKFGMIFVDGGHSLERAICDGNYAWQHLVPGGILAYHDYGHPNLPDVKLAVDALTDSWGVEPSKYGYSTVIMRKPNSQTCD